jgi:Ca2+/Na+ antiporter
VLSSQGRGRAFVLGSLTFMVALGVVCAVIAVAAILTERGASIYMPLMLLAALLVLIAMFVRPQIVRRYDELELRRITARDAEG